MENNENTITEKTFDFGEAIRLLKQGKWVARLGWNGKGMSLWLKPETIIKAEWCKDPTLKTLVEGNGGELLGLGTICMYTQDSSGRRAILTGWLASQSDMLSEDWVQLTGIRLDPESGLFYDYVQEQLNEKE